MSRIKGKAPKIMIAVGIVLLCAGLAVSGIAMYGKYQMSKIPGLTVPEALKPSPDPSHPRNSSGGKATKRIGSRMIFEAPDVGRYGKKPRGSLGCGGEKG